MSLPMPRWFSVLPPKTRIVLLVLWGIGGVSLVSGVVNVPETVAELRSDPSRPSVNPSVAPAIMTGALLATFAFLAVINWFLGKGKNWARIVFLVGCFLYFPRIYSQFMGGGVRPSDMLLWAFHLFALYVFFISDERWWFSRREGGG